MQKIRLFHLFSFEKQAILQFQDQTGHTHFWPSPICINIKRNQFISFVHSSDRVNFRVPSHDWPHRFWLHQPLNFQRPFNLHEFVPACKKSVNSWDTVNLRVQRPDLLNLLWRNSSFRNYAIWLAESILAYISGTRFFPNIGFVQEHSK